MKKLFIVAITVVFTMTGLQAQKIKTVSGSPEVISGVKDIAIVFTYENMKVGKMEEAAYIEREIGEREEKEAGTGERWAGLWKKDQEDRYPPRFIELFNEHGGALFGASVNPDATDSKYTIKVNTSWIEPGYNIGISRRPAGTNHEITIYETANPDVVLHELTILNSPGNGAMGYDFDAGLRIQESFAKAGKEYAKFLHKKHLK